MSRSGADRAVDSIRDDKELAQRVLGDGASALSSFDLSDEDWAPSWTPCSRMSRRRRGT
jgi:hypothetical protein